MMVMSWIVEEQIFKEFFSDRHALFQQRSGKVSAKSWLKGFTFLHYSIFQKLLMALKWNIEYISTSDETYCMSF